MFPLVSIAFKRRGCEYIIYLWRVLRSRRCHDAMCGTTEVLGTLKLSSPSSGIVVCYPWHNDKRRLTTPSTDESLLRRSEQLSLPRSFNGIVYIFYLAITIPPCILSSSSFDTFIVATEDSFILIIFPPTTKFPSYRWYFYRETFF